MPCAYCSQPLPTADPRAVYCSTRCRVAAHRQRGPVGHQRGRLQQFILDALAEHPVLSLYDLAILDGDGVQVHVESVRRSMAALEDEGLVEDCDALGYQSPTSHRPTNAVVLFRLKAL